MPLQSHSVSVMPCEHKNRITRSQSRGKCINSGCMLATANRHDRDFRNDLCGHNVRNRCPNLERNRPTSGEELKLTPNLRLFHVMIWSTWMMRGMPTCISRLLSPAKSLWPDAAKAVLKVTTFGCKPMPRLKELRNSPGSSMKRAGALRSHGSSSRMALPVAP